MAAPSPATESPATSPSARKGGGKLIPPMLLLALAGYGLYRGWDYMTVGRFIISTDDAYLKADVATIAARVSGHIAEVRVTDNQAVAAGDLLIKIDDGDYRLMEAAAREKIATQEAVVARIAEQGKAQNAQVAQAQAQIEAAEAEQRRADSAFARAETLTKSQYSSQASLETARADRDRALAALAANRAALVAAEANRMVIEAQRVEAMRLKAELATQLEKAQRDRSFTEIRAPFAGIVGNRAAQIGAYVQPGARLLALVPLESLYIEANFKETQLGRLREGQKVQVTLDANAERKIEGRLTSIAPASGSQFALLPPDNATGNFTKVVQRVPVRIALPDAVIREGWLRPGLSVVVGVDTVTDPTPKSARAVP